MLSFDHIAVAAASLDAAVAHVAAALGHDLGPGGRHDQMGTHNRLSGLGAGEYMEAIAIDPAAPAPPMARWFDLDRRQGPPRLSNWIARTADIEGFVAAYPEAGRIHALSRGPYRWRMAVPEDGALPFDGGFPAVIQWDSAPPQFPDQGLRLRALTLSHPEAARLSSILADLIEDARIETRQGVAGLEAEIVTPDGVRVLS